MEVGVGKLPQTVPQVLSTLVNLRWRTETGSSYKSVTGGDIDVMSTVRPTRHFFGHARSTFTGIDIAGFQRTASDWYKPEVETVPHTRSADNLATETDIDAISVVRPIPMFFGGGVFHCEINTRITGLTAHENMDISIRFFHLRYA